MRVYYAHPSCLYDTEPEADDIVRLSARFTTVVNPNTPSLQSEADKLRASGHRDRAMQPFLKALKSCDAVAYRPFEDGKIGAGVAGEILEALMLGKAVYRLPDLARTLPDMTDILSIAETRARLKRGPAA